MVEERHQALTSTPFDVWRERARPAQICLGLLALQAVLLAADFGAGPKAALGVLAVVALLPAGWLLDDKAGLLVLLAFVAARLFYFPTGGDSLLTVGCEVAGGSSAFVLARLAAAESRRARARVAREAEHDLRTPLTVLHGYISMLEDGSFPRERTRQLVSLLAIKTYEINQSIDSMFERIRSPR
jgi:signal transduction histidine kinase